MVYISRLLFIDLSRDGNFEISKAEFGHIFLQFHGHVYLVQGKEKWQWLFLSYILLIKLQEIMQ